MTCTCIEDTDALLAAHNTRLVRLISFARRGATVTIATEKLEVAKRGRPATVAPSFCPFCGLALHAAPGSP